MTTASEHTLIACHDCDLLHRIRPLRHGERAKCIRCGALLYRRMENGIYRTLMFAFTGLILFVMANVFPFMTFKLHGRVQESILSSGIKELYDQGLWPLAILVLFVSIIFPLVKIVGLLYVLVPLQFKRRVWRAAVTFRLVDGLHAWAMMDVFLLGVLVAFVKLSDMATLVLGIGVYSFAALILVMAAAGGALDSHEVWERLESAK